MTMVVKTTAKAIAPRAVRMAGPLLEGAAMLASDARKRVVATGKSGSGAPFSKYKRARRRRRGPKKFWKTGTMWRSLRAKLASPTRAVVGLSGKAATGNTKTKKGKTTRLTSVRLGRMLQRKESNAIIGPSKSEIASFQSALAAHLGPQVVAALGFEERAFKADRKGRSAARQAKRALRQMNQRR